MPHNPTVQINRYNPLQVAAHQLQKPPVFVSIFLFFSTLIKISPICDVIFLFVCLYIQFVVFHPMLAEGGKKKKDTGCDIFVSLRDTIPVALR